MTIQSILLGFEPKEENLLAAIKEISKNIGFFDAKSAKMVADHFSLPKSRVWSAASFYDEIKTKNPKARLLIQVCDGANCQTKMAGAIISQIESLFGQKVGDDSSSKLKIETISCIGRCLDGPIVVINGTVFEKATPGRIGEIMKSYL
jgi:NADH:ubiquinone oxidoreductase subunit E